MASVPAVSFTHPETLVSQSVRIFAMPGRGFAFFIQRTCTCFSVRQGVGFGGPPQPAGSQGALGAVARTSSRTRSYWFFSKTPFSSVHIDVGICPVATVQ